jgi:hypothetical protein
LILRCGNEATRCSGGAAHRNGLGTCHSKGAAVVVEEDATTMTKFFFVRVIARHVIDSESQPALKFRVNRPRPRSQPARAAGCVCWLFYQFFVSARKLN